ncbi:WbqC family protein [Dysgonomonas mossii]|uniref:WbqC family protein n=1 Tax=Dysgonomonas mossii TaxID=163665 RepID=UPI003994C06A
MNIYLSSAYLAPIQYYAKFVQGDHIFIEQNENYTKQSYRNRSMIVSANGSIPLSIPVVHSSSEKTLTKDIRIADHGNWQHMHWNAIVSAYNSTPFFEYYQDDFYPFYHKKYSFLFDFNEELRGLILGLLNIELPVIEYTSEYKTAFEDYEFDMRDVIHPKKDLSLDPSFVSIPYYQVFEQKLEFVENMSIVDLLFNMGNESQLILNNSFHR